MKKLLFIIAIVGIASCSKKDEETPKTPGCAWFPVISTTQVAYTKTVMVDSVQGQAETVSSVSTDKEQKFGDYTFSHNNCNELTLKTSFSEQIMVLKKDGAFPETNNFEKNGVKYNISQTDPFGTNVKRSKVSIYAPTKVVTLILLYEYEKGITELEIDENAGYSITKYVRK